MKILVFLGLLGALAAQPHKEGECSSGKKSRKVVGSGLRTRLIGVGDPSPSMTTPIVAISPSKCGNESGELLL